MLVLPFKVRVSVKIYASLRARVKFWKRSLVGNFSTFYSPYSAVQVLSRVSFSCVDVVSMIIYHSWSNMEGNMGEILSGH